MIVPNLKRAWALGVTVSILGLGAIVASSGTTRAESSESTPGLVVSGTAKAYALALPPSGKATGGNAGLGYTSAQSMRAKGQLPSYVQAMLEPAELGDASAEGGEMHLSSTRVTEVMNRHVNRIFNGCVLRELKRTPMSRVTIQMVISGQGKIMGATTKPGSKTFQGCVAKRLLAINFPKFSAPRMGADYTFSFE